MVLQNLIKSGLQATLEVKHKRQKYMKKTTRTTIHFKSHQMQEETEGILLFIGQVIKDFTKLSGFCSKMVFHPRTLTCMEITVSIKQRLQEI